MHESTEHYSVEDGNDIDSGCDVYCNHPEVIAASKVGSRGRIGDTTWATPNWCPLLVVAVENLIRERKAGVG